MDQFSPDVHYMAKQEIKLCKTFLISKCIHHVCVCLSNTHSFPFLSFKSTSSSLSTVTKTIFWSIFFSLEKKKKSKRELTPYKSMILFVQIKESRSLT